MRPKLGVVFELGDVEDFVFGFHVSVLGNAEVNADAAFVARFKSDAAIDHRFASTIDADAARPGANPDVLLLLVFQRIKSAHSRGMAAHVAHVDRADAGDAGHQVLPEFGEGVSIRSGQPNACDYNTG